MRAPSRLLRLAHRVAVGPPDVGRLVGAGGCSVTSVVALVLFLSRLHRVSERVR